MFFKISPKDQIILATGQGNFGRFLGFLVFFKDLWNNENKSCLNDIKIWEISGNLKTSKFWKLQLSISCGTQKSAKMPCLVANMIWSFLTAHTKFRNSHINKIPQELMGLKSTSNVNWARSRSKSDVTLSYLKHDSQSALDSWEVFFLAFLAFCWFFFIVFKVECVMSSSGLSFIHHPLK